MRHNLLFSFLFIVMLGACSSPYQAPVNDLDGGPRFLDSGKTHLVNDGETLYVIAWMYDLDFAALARANNLREPYSVSPGQVLTVDLRDQAVTAAAAPQIATRSGAVTTNPVQTTGAIQRAPLPGSGITRRELPSASSTVPAVEPPLASTRPGTTPDTLPTAPAAVPVLPPVATIETPGSNTTAGNATVQSTPRAQTPPPTQTSPPVQTPPAPTQAGPAVEPSPSVQTAEALPPIQDTPSAPVPAIGSLPANESPVPPVAAGQDINWDWPFRGAIIGRFGDAGVENKGLDLAGNKGDPILAAAAGEVVYSGSGLLRYGDLIIIKHNEHFLSAYAHNSELLVKEGDKVSRGQKIAELGSSGINRNMLHFEIRLDGKPVDPQLYLPAP